MQTATGSFYPSRLADLIAERGVDRDLVAEHCGVDQSTVWRWAKGVNAIPDPQKLRLAQFFNVTPAYLMGWPEQPEEAA